VADITVSEAIEAIYASLKADNEELDAHIAALKGAMAREGVKEATFETVKLVQPNRQGRKLMQSYFRKKGVAVGFV
jgi:cell division protein FtsB